MPAAVRRTGARVARGSRVVMPESAVARVGGRTLLALSALCRSEWRGDGAVAAGVSAGDGGLRLRDGAVNRADTGAQRCGVARNLLSAERATRTRRSAALTALLSSAEDAEVVI